MSGHPDGLTPLSDIDDNSPASQPLHPSPRYHSPHAYPVSIHPGDSPITGPQGNMLDVVSFGCPPGDYPAEDHAAALAHLLQDDALPPPGGSDPASGDSASGNIVSSFRGVTFSKGKWMASVMVNGRWAYREGFDSEVAAAYAYDRAMRRLNPNDADLFVNFKEDPGVQFKQEAGGPSAHAGAAFDRAWDSDGPVFADAVAPQVEDVQSGVSGSEAPWLRPQMLHSSHQQAPPQQQQQQQHQAQQQPQQAGQHVFAAQQQPPAHAQHAPQHVPAHVLPQHVHMQPLQVARAGSGGTYAVLPAGMQFVPTSVGGAGLGSPNMMSQEAASGAFRSRGMVKSASVSTLLAATTLSDTTAIATAGMSMGMEPRYVQWPQAAGVPSSAGFHAHAAGGGGGGGDMSAASLLLGADGGGSGTLDACGGARRPAGMKRVASAVDSSAMRVGMAHPGMAGSAAVLSPCKTETLSGGTAGSGGGGPTPRSATSGSARAGPGGMRRAGSAQELASAVSKPAITTAMKATAGIAKGARLTGATRVSNRRANSKYAKDKLREEAERSGKAAAAREAAVAVAVGAKSSGSDGPKTEEEMQAERLRVYQALRLGQERLHAQMRAHQAQHEEQQRRAAQREADKAAEARRQEEATAAAAASAAQAMHVPTSIGGSVLETVQEGGLYSGGMMTFVPTSSAAAPTGSGGKMPRRLPSEPHSLAAMGVAGMGGRHQPATTHASLGMRKVKSTSNFAQSAHQYAPVHSMHVSMAMPTVALRASPSMPSFPMAAHPPKEEPVDVAGLPHIAEDHDPLRLPDNVASMFLDEHDLAASDDLMTLMKDLQGAAPSGLDLDLGLAEPGADGGGASGETAGGGGGGGAAAGSPTAAGEGGVAGMDPEPATSAPHSVDVLDPAFFNLDGYDQLGMTMLDDDFTSAFMDS